MTTKLCPEDHPRSRVNALLHDLVYQMYSSLSKGMNTANEIFSNNTTSGLEISVQLGRRRYGCTPAAELGLGCSAQLSRLEADNICIATESSYYTCLGFFIDDWRAVLLSRSARMLASQRYNLQSTYRAAECDTASAIAANSTRRAWKKSLVRVERGALCNVATYSCPGRTRWSEKYHLEDETTEGTWRTHPG